MFTLRKSSLTSNLSLSSHTGTFIAAAVSLLGKSLHNWTTVYFCFQGQPLQIASMWVACTHESCRCNVAPEEPAASFYQVRSFTSKLWARETTPTTEGVTKATQRPA